MSLGLYSKWMYAWETALTTRDTNRVVRPLEWGFDFLDDLPPELDEPSALAQAAPLTRMSALNDRIADHPEAFFRYRTPADFRLELRPPELFPTNVRPETLAQERKLQGQAAAGVLAPVPFLRFTSPLRSHFPENDQVNARWYPADPRRQAGKPRQAILVLPQWNADAFSHNALCSLVNRFGISALRLSKPYHDIRRPAELERSDYAVSANLGRTIASCRQAVMDIRACLDWLESEGYEQFGILGTSLGSCYAFIAAAHDPRLRVCAFNHAADWFGDVVWTGQSTRHIREGLEQAGLTQDDTRHVLAAVSPATYMQHYAGAGGRGRETLVVHARYDLTFLPRYSHEILADFDRRGIPYTSRVLPCGHYTTGEAPYKYIDGWYLGSFVRSAFRRMAQSP